MIKPVSADKPIVIKRMTLNDPSSLKYSYDFIEFERPKNPSRV